MNESNTPTAKPVPVPSASARPEVGTVFETLLGSLGEARKEQA